MRLAAYAGASTALAAAVIVHAFNQRANFYSACVYLSQSNLCLMILTNLVLFIIASLFYGLQRIFFGPLRPIEVEQLYEKAWFAVTETCLAMTIFRDEVGAWFLVMFVALLAGKVWGWIAEGRVEITEQQPPANGSAAHVRLCLSLLLSLFYDTWLMVYTIEMVVQQAKPNMMVMFLFEFAVLATCSWSTALRYWISLVETRIVTQQTKERLEYRRAQVREERQRMTMERATAAASAEASGAEQPTDLPPLPSEDDIDEMDIEVPGWEEKGQWILSLDLVTDFVKLGIYTTFFVILLMFYGLPIHIMRDLFLTARSFIKRLTAFLRYRKATQDMNQRYPDATEEDFQREDTCIICREEMRPWPAANGAGQAPAAGGANGRPQAPTPIVSERSRPKKLPCGHVLHLGCLKSWLERQQVCPTCRRPVVVTPPRPNAIPGQHPGAVGPAGAGQAPNPAHPNQPPAPPQNGNVRMINFGPFRFAFGQGNLQDFMPQPPQQPAHQAGQPGAAPNMYRLELGFPRIQPQQPGAAGAAGAPQAANQIVTTIPGLLRNLEGTITSEIMQLRLNQQELEIIGQLQAQLTRLRAMRDGAGTGVGGQPPASVGAAAAALQPQMMAPAMARSGSGNSARGGPSGASPVPRHVQQHGIRTGSGASTPIPSGSADLPPGLTIPEGWSLLPLERLDQGSLGAEQNSTLAQMAAARRAVNALAHPVAPAAGPSGYVVPTSTTNAVNLAATAMARSSSNPLHPNTPQRPSSIQRAPSGVSATSLNPRRTSLNPFEVAALLDSPPTTTATTTSTAPTNANHTNRPSQPRRSSSYFNDPEPNPMLHPNGRPPAPDPTAEPTFPERLGDYLSTHEGRRQQQQLAEEDRRREEAERERGGGATALRELRREIGPMGGETIVLRTGGGEVSAVPVAPAASAAAAAVVPAAPVAAPAAPVAPATLPEEVRDAAASVTEPSTDKGKGRAASVEDGEEVEE